jgi:NTE family protein
MTPSTLPAGVSSEEVARLVQESVVFGSLQTNAREFLGRRLTPLTLRGGEVLMRQGDEPDSLYLIAIGRLRARVTLADGSETVVAEVGRGEVVGEMALLTNEPRSATVSAVRDSQVLRLPTDAYTELVQQHPDALRKITTEILRRLVRSFREGPSTSPVVTIAVVPLEPSPAVTELDERLHASLHRLTGASNHVTAEATAAALGDLDSVSAGRLASWFAQHETGYEVVVYEADAEPSAWTDACVRQADLILLVGDARESSRLRAVERAIANRRNEVPSRMRLVLVHPAGTRDPRGTSRWLAPRQVEMHHHVAVDRDDDVDRVARLLLGRGVGIVFSGGGARGIAGIGVVRALHERGIPIDAVGGTSIGSIIGGGVARRQAADEIAEVLRSAVLESSPFDVTFPVVSLAAGRRVTKNLQDGADGLDIEDAWRSFFCISTNLTSGNVEIHRSGPGWLAVRASFSLPGVFPPVPSATGDLLVDGGVLDNLPIGIMRAEHYGITVIGVDVGRTRDISAAGLPEGGVVSGWKMLLGKLNPGRSDRDTAGLGRILMRLTELGGTQDDDRGDICIRPAVDSFSIADFKAFDRLVTLGYEEGMRSLGEWIDASSNGSTNT